MEGTIRLSAGAAEALIAPEIGGGLARLRFGARDALRPAGAESLRARDPLSLAEFPMAPFVNRVGGGRFPHAGRTITLARPFMDTAIHGNAWLRPWSVVSAGADHAVLRLESAPCPEWPFAYEVARRFALTPAAFAIESTLTARGDEPMPASLGNHPYMPAEGAVLRLNATGLWETRDALPVSLTRPAVLDVLARGAPVSTLALDHCVVGWDGVAHVEWPTHALRILAEPNPGFFQIYTPIGADFFCIEPQTAMPDALNHPAAESGVRMLAPGEALRLRVTFAFEE